MIFSSIHLKEHYDFLSEDGKDPILDIYLAKNVADINGKSEKRPCILVCPGGGYSHCSEREKEPVAFHFLNEGYNVFVLTYSCAPHTFPSQIIEVAASLDLIHKNYDNWNCDTSKIAIMGFSAGAHLAAHYSNCYDIPQIRKYFPNSYPVSATVLSYPVISANSSIANVGSFRNLLGKKELSPEDVEKFSLENRVSEKTPPTYIWHTAEDNSVPVFNSIVYAKALSKYKIPYELHIFPFGWHGLATVDERTCGEINDKIKLAHSWILEVNEWLKIILK